MDLKVRLTLCEVVDSVIMATNVERYRKLRHINNDIYAVPSQNLISEHQKTEAYLLSHFTTTRGANLTKTIVLVSQSSVIEVPCLTRKMAFYKYELLQNTLMAGSEY